MVVVALVEVVEIVEVLAIDVELVVVMADVQAVDFI